MPEARNGKSKVKHYILTGELAFTTINDQKLQMHVPQEAVEFVPRI